MLGRIRVSKTADFRNGSGSSDPNRPKILKITGPPYSDTARVPGGLRSLAPSLAWSLAWSLAGGTSKIETPIEDPGRDPSRTRILERS